MENIAKSPKKNPGKGQTPPSDNARILGAYGRPTQPLAHHLRPIFSIALAMLF